ncbi:MAG TPA: hypothetical protein VFD91_10700, partial [Mariniphaga sp.]|nr:hypothetical protein [Mariniphaga sp.]
LNRIEIALNDTTLADSWKEIPLEVKLVTLRITEINGEITAEALFGQSAVESDIIFDDVNLNENNEFHIRSIDNAAAVSEVKSHLWYVKEQTSRILFINDYFGFSSQDVANAHLELLNGIGLNQVDYLNISDGNVIGGTRVPLSNAFPDRSLAAPTINLMLAEWDYIYWISDDLDRNIGYALELTTKFFVQGGKMFINIPIEFLADRNPLFQFLPFQAVQAEPAQQYPRRSPTFQVQRCSEITATDEINYTPSLRMRRSVQPANPIISFDQSVSLFDAKFRLILRNPTEIGSYDGPATIATMNPEQSILYFGFDFMDFTTIDNNPCKDSETGESLPPSDMEGLLDFLLIETLGFDQ